MFETKAFKKDALRQLKGRWTIPVIVSIIWIILELIAGSVTFTHIPFSTLLSTAATLFICGTTLIAISFFFETLRNTSEKIGVNVFFEGCSMWLPGFLGMLWYTLWVFLWMLLFFIPGIIKSIAYSQMFFVLAENPKMSVAKAMNISKAMTKGFKGDLFWLDVTFLGWHFLGIITCGILEAWIIPYQTLTFTNAYYFLKQHAFQTGELSPADFN